MPNPDTTNHDLGKIIFPSENLAIAQNITDATSPKINNNPFEVSIGILVKGKQKSGNKTITKNNAQNEILSNILELIIFLNK